MNCDLVIRNGDVLTPRGKVRVDIGVKAGSIAAIAMGGAIAGEEYVDATGKIILPGGVDMHVHFRDPGATHKEDFLHGTAAAACGGVTTICDMPNTKPAVVSADTFAAKLAHVSSSAHVDFALWAGGVSIDEFSEFKRLGAVGLKVYMNRAMPGSQSYSDDLSMPDDATFVRVLKRAAELNWPVCVHVANSILDEAVKARLIKEGRKSSRDVCMMTRSPESAEAQARAIHFANVTGARLHIAHISYNSLEALRGFQIARDEPGSRVTAEVVPPCLNFEALDQIGPLGIPFAHSDGQNDEYWSALNSGLIDVVATDHAPHTREEKQQGLADAWQAPSGYPAVETMMPLLIDAALAGRLTFERLIQISAEAPAKICGLASKGAIEIGKDADLLILNPGARSIVNETRLHSKAGWSPFHGRELRGRIENVFLRGREVSRNGELSSASPIGRHAVLGAQERNNLAS